MLILKAGYYIDEIKNKLSKLVGLDTLENFYSNNLYFTVNGLPLRIDPEKPSPLSKVAWNILTRGELTRASIDLADGLLKDYFKDYYNGVNNQGAETKLVINESFWEGLNKNDTTVLLNKFNVLSEEDLVNFGSRYFALYNILKGFIKIAQVQQCILLFLLGNENLLDYTFNFQGIKHELANKIIEDLNNLFTALNSLSAEEMQLPKLKYDSVNAPGTIAISLELPCNGITIQQFKEPKSDFFSQIFTDRHVKYKILGKVLKVEQQNEYQEYFKFKHQKQQKALLYFLQNIFRKNEFRPGQEAIINRALQANDVIGLLPTGGGKSLTFQLCGLLQPGITVIIDPINSLMKDQYEKLLQNGIDKTVFINSFKTNEEKDRHLELLAEGKYQFVFISPERLQIQKFRDALSFCKGQSVYYSYAVIDEAHCVSEWGHDFRHSYLKLAQNLRQFCHSKESRLPLFGLTATASFDVLADVQRELEMQDNSIVTLPPKAIDRKELHFDILPVDCKLSDELEWHQREKELGKLKYPTIKDLLKDMPDRIRRFEKDSAYVSPSNGFYERTDDEYSNAGIIFCPSKSDKLPFGVLHLKNGKKVKEDKTFKPPIIFYDGSGLKEIPFLKIGTFFGSQDNDTVQDEYINQQADESVKNQESFLKNELNLMIATKAFGMGIDKPNIRFTVHYAFPNSIESFYQEAGRAGRDENPSLCSIIYHPDDEKMNLKFHAASFRGIQREKDIINELLDEVQYEDGFFLNLITQKIKDIYPEVASLNIFADKFIYINGKNELIFAAGKWVLKEPEAAIKIGRVTLNPNLDSSPKDVKNFDPKKSEEIIAEIKKIIYEECPDHQFLSWLKTKSADGINTLIENNRKKDHCLKIGFNNDVISKMSDKIKNDGISDFKDIYIKAAYKFSNDEKEFFESLQFEYKKAHYFLESLVLSADCEKYLRESYNRIRNTSDTLRAIYRMSIVGIIDDYVVDYVGEYLEVRFRGKTDAQYKKKFEEYLRRYLGVEKTKEWIKEVDAFKDKSPLKRVLYALIKFIDQEIGEKRKRSINYMKRMCEDFEKVGEKEFRERMVQYFTSKYAKTDYLPKATENGTLQNAAIVKQYIEYIFDPPDRLGGPIDNAKHLRGACDNLRINMRENASIDLLTSFCFFALDTKPQQITESQEESSLFIEAKELFRNGFKRLLQKEDWETCKELLKFFNEKVIDINPDVKPLIEPFTNEILINRTTYRLSQFINKINSNER